MRGCVRGDYEVENGRFKECVSGIKRVRWGRLRGSER